MHVLTLTPFYPTAADDAQGCFIAEPLQHMEEFGVTHSVIAVQPFYRGKTHANPAIFPARWKRYFAIPGGKGLASAGFFLFVGLLSEVRRLHKSRPIDLIHAHAPLPCGHAAALLSHEFRIPFVVSVHGLDAFADNQVKGWAGRWCRHVSQYVYRSAKNVICISGKVRERVLEGGANYRTSVVYNGVDHELFSSPTETVNRRPVILSVGNLISIKGHELLLRALALIQAKFPDLSCEIIGDGPERSHLDALVSELGLSGKVNFRGRCTRAEVAEAMRQCSLFVLPSRYEGLCLSGSYVCRKACCSLSWTRN